jgi:Protein of unknown function (DUF3352)
VGFVFRAVALVAVLLLVGCGGGGSADDASPATIVPADAVVYGEMVVRPEGSLRSDALDAAAKVFATDDPEARIRELLREASGRSIVDSERDVEPWLGDRVGFWGSAEHAGVVLLAADDPDAARESVEAVLRRGKVSFSSRSHGGVDYLLTSDGVAAGIVDGWLAIGRERVVVRTIDAAAGDSLADTDEYADAVGRLPDDRLAHFWADTAGLLDSAMRRHGELSQLRGLVPIDDLPPVAGAFLADGDRVALEVRSDGDLGVEAHSTPLVGELPGDAWAAAGTADLGRSLRDGLDRFRGAIGGVAVRARVREELGLDLDRDVLDWIGDTAFFLRGTTRASIDGGLVIRPTDEARAADAFGRIVGAIQQAGGFAPVRWRSRAPTRPSRSRRSLRRSRSSWPAARRWSSRRTAKRPRRRRSAAARFGWLTATCTRRLGTWRARSRAC